MTGAPVAHTLIRPSCRQTRGAGTPGVEAAKTEESVTLGRVRKRERLGDPPAFTPDTVTVGALNMGVKPSNVSMGNSTILPLRNARESRAWRNEKREIMHGPKPKQETKGSARNGPALHGTTHWTEKRR